MGAGFFEGLQQRTREGGTRALGSGVPAVAHDLLNALPADRWQAEKGKYVYESWVAAAKVKMK